PNGIPPERDQFGKQASHLLGGVEVFEHVLYLAAMAVAWEAIGPEEALQVAVEKAFHELGKAPAHAVVESVLKNWHEAQGDRTGWQVHTKLKWIESKGWWIDSHHETGWTRLTTGGDINDQGY